MCCVAGGFRRHGPKPKRCVRLRPHAPTAGRIRNPIPLYLLARRGNPSDAAPRLLALRILHLCHRPAALGCAAGGAQAPAKSGGPDFGKSDAQGLSPEQLDLLTVLVLAYFDHFAHIFLRNCFPASCRRLGAWIQYFKLPVPLFFVCAIAVAISLLLRAIGREREFAPRAEWRLRGAA